MRITTSQYGSSIHNQIQSFCVQYYGISPFQNDFFYKYVNENTDRYELKPEVHKCSCLAACESQSKSLISLQQQHCQDVVICRATSFTTEYTYPKPFCGRHSSISHALDSWSLLHKCDKYFRYFSVYKHIIL